jgi:hypothetical protein
MKFHTIGLSLCFLTILVIGCTQTFSAKAASIYELVETIDVNVDCTTAGVDITTTLSSDNSSHIHFPSEVDINAPSLHNITLITLEFSAPSSTLEYMFNISDTTKARSIADTLTTNMSTGFATSFGYNTSASYGGYTYVLYSALGKGNLTQYTEECLIPQCLASDLQGFSLTFLPNTQKQQASIQFSATKILTTYWLYMMISECETSIPTGSDTHIIDVLELLGVSSLAPSPYNPPFIGMYMASISLDIYSDETVSYLSCEPGLANETINYRGWTISTDDTSVSADFSFGMDPSPVSPLTLTVNAIIVPEFTSLTLMIILALTAAIAMILKKRLPKTPN